MKGKHIAIGVLLIVALSAAFIPFASQFPDGLEKVAGDQGFASKQSESPPFSAPFPDYKIPGVGNESLSSVVTGIAGGLAMFFVGSGIALILNRRKSK
jgi:hypothetical protein